MTIKHDRSFLSTKYSELVKHGYGYETVRNFRFQFVYSAMERAENRNRPGPSDMSSTEWNKICAESAQKRSEHIKRVLDAIAEKHPCYQYNVDGMERYKSNDWDLFFWCNDLYSTTGGMLSGMDYSYFTLNLNEAHSVERRVEVYNSVMSILDQFKDDENIEVYIQHQIEFDEKRIAEDAEMIAPRLVGTSCRYTVFSELFNLTSGPVEGRVVEANGRYYFMKKRARSRGYLLDNKKILQIYLTLEKTG